MTEDGWEVGEKLNIGMDRDVYLWGVGKKIDIKKVDRVELFNQETAEWVEVDKDFIFNSRVI
jgi:hypothetical protein